MKILAPEWITYGVEDMDAARRFWTDFGLNLAEKKADSLVFETVEKSKVVIRPKDAEDLPPAVIGGSTAREITWGVESADDLKAIADALWDINSLRVEDDVVRVVDPNGYPMAFRQSVTQKIAAVDQEYNEPGAVTRIDRRARTYDRATPQLMEHVVFFSPKLEEAEEFYRDRLQFQLTDRYPSDSIFLRCNGNHAHHNLFFLKTDDDKLGFHHAAFQVSTIHEVFGGGLHMTDQGWKTRIGPGRHPISSSYFWYFHNPCGGAAEYDWDTDYITDDWTPRVWPKDHESFAEWALYGVDRYDPSTRTPGS
jgi:catechol 2,3-dioxygenase-like lactoylglutathione lyase family enzyme